MHSAHTYISNFHISVYRSAHFKLILRGHVVAKVFAVTVPEIEDVDHFSWSTFNTFKYHIVILLIRQVKFHNLKHLVFHSIFKSLLTKLTLE